MLHLYNTASRTKEPIALPEGQRFLTLYSCGPTVYNYAHIGNLRTYVFEDLLRRTIKYFGFPLIQAMNLTDVDDKTIQGAVEEGTSLTVYTRRYKKAFFEDLKTLRIESVEIICAATDHIAPMIEMIETLLKKGIAYKGSDGGIYYSIERFPSYGRLSRLKLDDLKEGASNRVAEDEYDKESASDFVLWKPYDQKRDGDVFWESPFGKGRPGWHIECSAMATHYLGETIDLHLGGVDNIFPHHENEIAQSEGCSGKHFVRHWIHVHHLIVDGKKMSKSLGNFYTLRDLLAEGYTGEEVRYLLLSTHYRTRLNFTLNRLDAVRHTLARFSDFIHRLKTACGDRVVLLDPMIERCRTSFTAALGDDLNISVALASLFELIKEVNPLIDEEKVSTSEAEKVLVFLEELNTVLAVLPLREKEVAIPPEIREAVEKRQRARIAKDWVEADKQREFIRSQGFAVEDGPSGPRVKRG